MGNDRVSMAEHTYKQVQFKEETPKRRDEQAVLDQSSSSGYDSFKEETIGRNSSAKKSFKKISGGDYLDINVKVMAGDGNIEKVSVSIHEKLGKRESLCRNLELTGELAQMLCTPQGKVLPSGDIEQSNSIARERVELLVEQLGTFFNLMEVRLIDQVN